LRNIGFRRAAKVEVAFKLLLIEALLSSADFGKQTGLKQTGLGLFPFRLAKTNNISQPNGAGPSAKDSL
jgi:hypothetical protein